MTALFDPGLQPERTLLAWRRTCLSLAVASAVSIRLTAEDVGVPGILAGVAGLFIASVTWLVVTVRHRRVLGALRRNPVQLTAGAIPMMAMSAAAAMVATSCLALMLSGHS